MRLSTPRTEIDRGGDVLYPLADGDVLVNVYGAFISLAQQILNRLKDSESMNNEDVSIRDRVERYSNMWTTDLHKYGLLEADPPSPQLGLVFDLDRRAPIVMDDDPEVIGAVFENMRRAGVRRLSWEESAFKAEPPTDARK